MYTETWRPGSNNEFDTLFESLRQEQFRDTSHPLHKNYSWKHFNKECAALSITFNNEGKPLVLSSILFRHCFPDFTFRVANRFWKVSEDRLHSLNKNQGMFIFGDSVRSQVEYAQQELGARLVFISREYAKWQKFVAENLRSTVNLPFEYDNYRYLTCENPVDDNCWQHIVYYGDSEILNKWERK
jgi:hypothetical protein